MRGGCFGGNPAHADARPTEDAATGGVAADARAPGKDGMPGGTGGSGGMGGETGGSGGAVPDAELERFFAQGFTPRQALELVVGIATYTLSIFANRMTRSETIR